MANLEGLMTEQKIFEDNNKISIPEVIPILPMHNVLVFPKTMIPLEISGSASQLIDEAMMKDRLVGLVMTKKEPDNQSGIYTLEELHEVGTCAAILKMAKTSENRTQMLLQGISRFTIVELLEGKPYQQAHIKLIEEKEIKDIETEALMSNLLMLFDRILKLSPFLPPEFGPMAKTITDAGMLADLIASIINAPVEEKQKILDTADAKQRLKELTRMVNHQMEVLELGNKIQTKVKDDIDKSQRDYYLRQQLKAIRKRMLLRPTNIAKRLRQKIFRRKQKKKPRGNWNAFPACTPPLRNTRLPRHIWTGSQHCPGMNQPRITWISKRPAMFWMKITMGWPRLKNASLNIWPCANLNRIPKGRSYALWGLRAPAKHRLAIPSRERLRANLYACRSAAYTTKRKYAAIAAPTSALCLDALSRD
jgi:Lon protease-like protein